MTGPKDVVKTGDHKVFSPPALDQFSKSPSTSNPTRLTMRQPALKQPRSNSTSVPHERHVHYEDSPSTILCDGPMRPETETMLGDDLGPMPSHPMPRRAPQNASVTLHHHLLARQSGLRQSRERSSRSGAGPSALARRESSDDKSVDAGRGEPSQWLDSSSQLPLPSPESADEMLPHADHPQLFSQQPASSAGHRLPFTNFLHPTPQTTKSSSADEYRSIVDDLTIQIQRLKKENRRLRQQGPHAIKDEQLFEVRCHDVMSRKKKRELETTLRDFATGLDASRTNSQRTSTSSGLKRSSSSRYDKTSGAGLASKQDSSWSPSQSRLVDSAYASASDPSGGFHTGSRQNRPVSSADARASSDRKVEKYLRAIPENSYPLPVVLTDKEKKRIVVRRLEQIFTGRFMGHAFSKSGPAASARLGNAGAAAALVSDAPVGTAEPQVVSTHDSAPAPPVLPTTDPTLPMLPLSSPTGSDDPELSREAQMLPRDSGVTSDSSNDQLGDAAGQSQSLVAADQSASAAAAMQTAPPLDQRPTRPLDLDPDRVQVPSENMEYLHHLGLGSAQSLSDSKYSSEDVPIDADGWVYLNILCNMAQLHMLNVTPAFVKAAVSEKSTKFQLSPDGRQIRWRGGSEGTRFSSDSSSGMSHPSLAEDESDLSEEQRLRGAKRRRLANPAIPGKHPFKSGEQPAQSIASSFHYKPLFARRASSSSTTDGYDDDEDDDDDDGDQDMNGSYFPGSQWGRSGSGGRPHRRKRQANGALIYYSGGLFCIDLSRDRGEASSETNSGDCLDSGASPAVEDDQPPLVRTSSGSLLAYRPLSDGLDAFRAIDDAGSPTRETHDDDDDLDMAMPWSASASVPVRQPMQASGAFGVEPGDNFAVLVTTRRPREWQGSGEVPSSDAAVKSMIDRLACTELPRPVSGRRDTLDRFSIEDVTQTVEQLQPSRLPEPLNLLMRSETTASSMASTCLSESESCCDNGGNE